MRLDRHDGQPVGDLVGEGHGAVDEGGRVRVLPDEVGSQGQAGDEH